MVLLVGSTAALTFVIVPDLRNPQTEQRMAMPVPGADDAGRSGPPPEAPLVATPPPANLPTVDYWPPPPAGFPSDPAPLSTTPLREALHPTVPVGAYDAPAGRPLAWLAPTIRGVELTMPVIERRAGWAAVLLPSVNRSVAWVPPGGWTTVPLRDQLVVARRTHQLFWLRDGGLVRSWRVSLGVRQTPTPLGRTFVLGRSTLAGEVYADTDVFALGAVPDDPGAIPPALKGAHIGVHTWYHDRELGRNTTDGCIRLTKKGQRELLTEIRPGTSLVVVDRFSAPATQQPALTPSAAAAPTPSGRSAARSGSRPAA